MEFYIGQIFIDSYPVEAVNWFEKRQDCYIKEIEPENDHRRFQIVPVPAPTEQEILEQELSALQSYLSSTDWYAIRQADSGEMMPEEVKARRAEARVRISEIREMLAAMGSNA